MQQQFRRSYNSGISVGSTLTHTSSSRFTVFCQFCHPGGLLKVAFCREKGLTALLPKINQFVGGNPRSLFPPGCLIRWSTAQRPIAKCSNHCRHCCDTCDVTFVISQLSSAYFPRAFRVFTHSVRHLSSEESVHSVQLPSPSPAGPR